MENEHIDTLTGFTALEPTPRLGSVRLRVCGAGFCGTASAEKSILFYGLHSFSKRGLVVLTTEEAEDRVKLVANTLLKTELVDAAN